jgi:hypothetical protein
MRFTTALPTVRACYIFATFLLSPLVSYADSAPMATANVIRDDATFANQDVVRSPRNRYRTPGLHRLSRGCGFHHENLKHGLSC